MTFFFPLKSLSLNRWLRPSGPTAVLASVKSGAAWPTFKLVCGAAGALAGAGDGVGVCATAIDAVASRKTKLRAFLIIDQSPSIGPGMQPECTTDAHDLTMIACIAARQTGFYLPESCP